MPPYLSAHCLLVNELWDIVVLHSVREHAESDLELCSKGSACHRSEPPLGELALGTLPVAYDGQRELGLSV